MIDYKFDRLYIVRNPYGFITTLNKEVQYEDMPFI